MISTEYICPNCRANETSIFYEAKDIPVNSCILLSTEKEALSYPRGDIVLGFCRSCGFIYNTTFDTSKVNYSSAYEDQQSCSSTFNAFAKELAEQLVNKHELFCKTILEIGCGKGDFLALLCELGNNSGVGIDPAFIGGRVQTSASSRLTFIRDYYSERYSNYHGDLVCSRHTLEHIPNTFDFIKVVRKAIGNRLDTVVFFEIPDIVRILHELAFWDIYYEHCSYFSLGSLARLFRSNKFEVTGLSRAFDDQYLLIEAKPVNVQSTKIHELEESISQLTNDVNCFSKCCSDKISRWKNLLAQTKAEGKRTVIWGSGSKCVAFMTTLGIRDEIEYIVDINPHRHGKFIPGAAKKIMPPEFLKEHKPDCVIIMNSIYSCEIKQRLDEMCVKTEVITV